MKTAYIFHDAFCDQNSDWYPWMKTTLESAGFVVTVPHFPTPAGQSYQSWLAVVKNFIPKFDTETIIIGHGTGGVFALRLVQDLKVKIHGLFLVATYAEKIGHAGYDRVNESFFKDPIKFDTIKKNAQVIEIFAGDDDPFVPMAITQKLAESLDEEVQKIPDGGHLNKASGFTQAVPIAQGIKESLSALDKTIAVEEAPTEVAIAPSIPEIKETPRVEEQKPAEFPKKVPTVLEIEQERLHPLSPQGEINSKPQIETMYQDMSTLVSSNSGKVSSSLLRKAHNDEEYKKAISPASPKNIMYVLGTVCVLVIAVGILGYLISEFAPTVQVQAPAPVVQSLIAADTHQKIDIAGKQSYQIEESIRAALIAPQENQMIRDIYYRNNDQVLNFSDLLTSLGINTPDSLSGELNQPFMHGVGSYGGIPAYFLVIPISHYDIAFSGMHDWEPTLLRDLGVFLNVPATFLKTQIQQEVFHDELISNQEVHVLRYTHPAYVTLDDIINSPIPAISPTSTTVSPTTSSSVVSKDTHSTVSSSTTVSSVTTTSPTDSASTSNVSTSASVTQIFNTNNPLLSITSPYREGDIMMVYFFLNEHTLIITNRVDIIPEILKRWANSQIYKQ